MTVFRTTCGTEHGQAFGVGYRSGGGAVRWCAFVKPFEGASRGHGGVPARRRVSASSLPCHTTLAPTHSFSPFYLPCTLNRAFFVDVLSSFLTSTKFTRYELHELVAPTCEAESAAAASDPATRALEAAHALAFRSGLGNSIFAASGHHVSSEDVKAYAQSVFSQGNVAVVGTGIDASTLEKLLEKSLGSSFASASATSSTPSTYFGGETRVDSHDGPQTVFIGFGTTGAPSAELAVLAAHLDPTPSVKWSQGTSPIAAKLPAGASVRSVLLPYSDASLFGLLVQGETSADVKAAGQAAVQALKASGSLSGDDLKKAVAKAKFAAASSFDAREGLLAALGPKVSSLALSLSTRQAVPLICVTPSKDPFWYLCFHRRGCLVVREGRRFCVLEGGF